MSVKTMTPEQIRNDLKTIALTWPDGVPWQQIDRVNALKGELKRRGEPIDGPSGPAPGTTPLTAMTKDELESELRVLSARDDEASRTRFADVRFELRRRFADNAEPARQVAQVAVRELELPDEVPNAGGLAGVLEQEALARVVEAEPKRVVGPRRPLVPSPKSAPLEKKPPKIVCGYSATGRTDGSVLIEHEVTNDTTSIVVASVLDDDQADDFVAMVTAARARARRMAAGE